MATKEGPNEDMEMEVVQKDDTVDKVENKTTDDNVQSNIDKVENKTTDDNLQSNVDKVENKTTHDNLQSNFADKEEKLEEDAIEEKLEEDAKEEKLEEDAKEEKLEKDIKEECGQVKMEKGNVEDSKDQQEDKKGEFTIFVGKLSASVTENALKKYFKSAGEIVGVSMPWKVVRKTKRHGIAFIDFATKAAYDAALKMDQMLIDGEPILVLPATKTREGLLNMQVEEHEESPTREMTKSPTTYVPLHKKSNHVAFLKVIPQGVTEDEVLKFLKFTRSDIVGLTIYYKTKRNKYRKSARGVIAFHNAEDLQKCMAQTGRIMKGQEITIERYLFGPAARAAAEKRPASSQEEVPSPKKQPKLAKSMDMDLFVKHPGSSEEEFSSPKKQPKSANSTEMDLFVKHVPRERGLLLDRKRFYKNKIRVAIRRDRDFLKQPHKQDAVLSYSAFVGGLCLKDKAQVVHNGLSNFFKKSNINVKRINVPKSAVGLCKGYAFIEFADEESLITAQAIREIEIKGLSNIVTISDRWPEGPMDSLSLPEAPLPVPDLPTKKNKIINEGPGTFDLSARKRKRKKWPFAGPAGPSQPPPFQKPPFQKPPFQKPPFQKTPFQKTTFQKTPFQKTPFQKTPFQKPPFQQPPVQPPRSRWSGGSPNYPECPDHDYDPHQEEGNFPLQEGGNFPHRGVNFPHQEGGNFPHQEGGNFPHQEGGNFPHQEGGNFPYREEGNFPHREEGNFPHQEGGNFPHQGGNFPPQRGGNDGNYYSKDEDNYESRSHDSYEDHHSMPPPRDGGGYRDVDHNRFSHRSERSVSPIPVWLTDEPPVQRPVMHDNEPAPFPRNDYVEYPVSSRTEVVPFQGHQSMMPAAPQINFPTPHVNLAAPPLPPPPQSRPREEFRSNYPDFVRDGGYPSNVQPEPPPPTLPISPANDHRRFSAYESFSSINSSFNDSHYHTALETTNYNHGKLVETSGPTSNTRISQDLFSQYRLVSNGGGGRNIRDGGGRDVRDGIGRDGGDGIGRDGMGRDGRDGMGRDVRDGIGRDGGDGIGRDGMGRDGMGRDGGDGIGRDRRDGRDGMGRDGRDGMGRDGGDGIGRDRRDGMGRDGMGRDGRGGIGRDGMGRDRRDGIGRNGRDGRDGMRRDGRDGGGRDGRDGMRRDGGGRDGRDRGGRDGRDGGGRDGRDGGGRDGRDGGGRDGRDGGGRDGRDVMGRDGRDGGGEPSTAARHLIGYNTTSGYNTSGYKNVADQIYGARSMTAGGTEMRASMTMESSRSQYNLVSYPGLERMTSGFTSSLVDNPGYSSTPNSTAYTEAVTVRKASSRWCPEY